MSFLFFTRERGNPYVGGVFMVDAWSGLGPFVMTDAGVRGRERPDTWRVFELLRTEVSGPRKDPREGCL